MGLKSHSVHADGTVEDFRVCDKDGNVTLAHGETISKEAYQDVFNEVFQALVAEIVMAGNKVGATPEEWAGNLAKIADAVGQSAPRMGAVYRTASEFLATTCKVVKDLNLNHPNDATPEQLDDIADRVASAMASSRGLGNKDAN